MWSLARAFTQAISRASGWPLSAASTARAPGRSTSSCSAAMCVVVKPAMRDEDAAGHVVNPVTAWSMFDIVKGIGLQKLHLHRRLQPARQADGRAGARQRLAMIAVIRKESQAAHLKGARRKACADPVRPGVCSQARSPCANPRSRASCSTRSPVQLSADIFTAMPARARWIIYGKLDTEAPVLKRSRPIHLHGQEDRGLLVDELVQAGLDPEKLRTLRAVQNRFISGAWNTEVVATVRLADAMRICPKRSNSATAR
jgi:hypothetical protein